MTKLKGKMEAFLGIDPDEERVRMKQLAKTDNFRTVIDCWQKSFPDSAVRDLAEKRMEEIVARVSHAAALLRIRKEVPFESELAHIVDNALNTVLPAWLGRPSDLEWVLRKTQEHYHLKKLRRHFEKRALELIDKINPSEVSVEYLVAMRKLAPRKTLLERKLEFGIALCLDEQDPNTVQEIDRLMDVCASLEESTDQSLRKVKAAFGNHFAEYLPQVLLKTRSLETLLKWCGIVRFDKEVFHLIVIRFAKILFSDKNIENLIELFNASGDIVEINQMIDRRLVELLHDYLPKEKDLRKLIDMRMKCTLATDNKWEEHVEFRMLELVDEINDGRIPRWLPDILERKGILTGDKIPFMENDLVAAVGRRYTSLYAPYQ